MLLQYCRGHYHVITVSYIEGIIMLLQYRIEIIIMLLQYRRGHYHVITVSYIEGIIMLLQYHI